MCYRPFVQPIPDNRLPGPGDCSPIEDAEAVHAEENVQLIGDILAECGMPSRVVTYPVENGMGAEFTLEVNILPVESSPVENVRSAIVEARSVLKDFEARARQKGIPIP